MAKSIENIIKTPKDRVFFIDEKCYIIYTGTSLIDLKPLLRIGNSDFINEEIAKYIEYIVVPDGLIEDIEQEKNNINVAELKESSYVGTQLSLKEVFKSLKKLGLPVEDLKSKLVEASPVLNVKIQELSLQNKAYVTFFKDGNISLSIGKEKIFDYFEEEKYSRYKKNSYHSERRRLLDLIKILENFRKLSTEEQIKLIEKQHKANQKKIKRTTPTQEEILEINKKKVLSNPSKQNAVETKRTKAYEDLYKSNLDFPDTIAGKKTNTLKKKNRKILSILGISILILTLFVVTAIIMNNHFKKEESAGAGQMPGTQERTADRGSADNNGRSTTDNRITTRPEQRETAIDRGRVQRTQDTGVSRRQRRLNRRRRRRIARRNSINNNELIKKYRRIVNKYNRMAPDSERIRISSRTDMPDMRIYNNYRVGRTIPVNLNISDIINATNRIAKINGYHEMGRPVAGKKDPNIIYPGQKIKIPGGNKISIKKHDYLWKIAINFLKINYRKTFLKIFYFNKKIRQFRKRRVDNFSEFSIMEKEIKRIFKKTYNHNQKKVLKKLLRNISKIKRSIRS